MLRSIANWFRNDREGTEPQADPTDTAAAGLTQYQLEVLSGKLQILPGNDYRKYLIPVDYLPSRRLAARGRSGIF